MKKWYPRMLAALFCLFLFVPGILLLFGPKETYSEREKRYLAQGPAWSWEGLLDGSSRTDLEAWLEDQFPGRDAWVGLNAYWTLATGRNAWQDIYLAREDYLLKAPEKLNLENFQKSLKRFESFAADSGLPTSMLLVPTPGAAKEALLPMGHLPYHDELLYETAAETLDHVALLDPRAALAQGDVYYHTDHHLTSCGNYQLYTAWREARGLSYLPTEAYVVETIDGFYGTAWSGSGYWLTPPDAVELWDSGATVSVTVSDGGKEPMTADSLFFREHLEELDKYPVFLDGNHTLTEIHNPDAPEGTLLIIKDSYAHGFAPFLADHYQHIYLLDLRFYRGSVTDFIQEKQVEELLYLYGISTLLTDTNSAWLF